MRLFLFLLFTLTAAGVGGNHAGQCPSLGPGAIGTCIEACTDDSSCPQGQKCCSNGCGRTCQKSVAVGGGGGGGTVHPGQCPAPSGGVSSCLATCSDDSSCASNEKCCSTGCGISCQKVVSSVVTAHAGQCPAVASGTLGSCIIACSDDGSCAQNEKCCSNGCGRTCQPIANSGGGGGSTHAGQCPVASGGFGACVISCTGDDSCPQNEKCCSNGCGRTCQTAVTSGGGSGGTVHTGQCPRPSGGVSSCIATCSDDSACPSNQKCCSNGCGITCQKACLLLFCPAVLCPISQQQTNYDSNGCPTCPSCNGNGNGNGNGQCSTNSDCRAKQSCVNGRCRPTGGKGPCQNGVCPAGQHCVNNICRVGSS